MKFPRIYKGYVLEYEVPENYEELIKNIDEQFIKITENLAKKVLEEFGGYKYPSFQWDEKRGLHSIVIGNGRGAYLDSYTRRWIFKNIGYENQALAVFNIISMYLNKLQEK